MNYTHNIELEHGHGETHKLTVKSDKKFEELEKILEETHTVRVD